MEAEHTALLRNATWDLVPKPQHANVVFGKWIFKHKFHADGSLERHKARWVLRGFTQRTGIDYVETFSPVVKPATVRTLDVTNAFLHGTLTDTVYCVQPSGFEDPAHLEYVCRFNKSFRFATYLTTLGFVESKSDTSLFVYQRGPDTAYLLYVDDIILTASSTALLRRIIGALQQQFSMKDLGTLHHLLGMHVQPHDGGLFLSQRQYMLDILDRAGTSECKLCLTPVDTNPKLSDTDGALVQDATDFRSLAGALQYLTFTRLAYAVQQVCLHVHAPCEPHLAALKRILRYIRVFLGDNLVSWSSKLQMTVSRSCAEAEYHAVANAVAEASWLRQLLQELHAPLRRSTLVYCDNISTVYIASNPVQHQRTKHIEIDLHFVRDRVALGEVRVLHVPTSLQFADFFTKGLPSPVFTEFRSSLNVRQAAVSTGGVGGWKRIWKRWAPLKCKYFLWLAKNNRCCTAERLAKRGLQHPMVCPFCDQADETIQHILVGYVFSCQIWAKILHSLNSASFTPLATDTRLFSLWAHSIKLAPKEVWKGLNTVHPSGLGELEIQKFVCSRAVNQVSSGSSIGDEGLLWCRARAANLHVLFRRSQAPAGGYVFAVSVQRTQLLLQVLNVKRFHHQQQKQQQQASTLALEELATSEINEICDYFSRRVACEPYDASRVASFITLLTLPISVLREFISLIAWKRSKSQAHGEIASSQRVRVELGLEKHHGSVSDDHTEGSSSSKSSMKHDRANSSVDFGLTFVLENTLKHLSTVGGAAWLPYCVSVRLRYIFGDNGHVMFLAMEGSHSGKACWLQNENWERCKQTVARAVEAANGCPAIGETGQGRLRLVAEMIHKQLQLSLQQLRDAPLSSS
ncbi:hypothetical protein U9M48_039563 [Paspalum notatum var. saurae]|uniref:Reverse transcriptase Ty1/copia-type domain-containing protein n=1 Tax=Paspalum notatum var. saurae TaxID=547442 RepID=A0AAQ3XCU2_PASNO